MDAQVEEVGPCKRLLKIQVPKEDIAERIQEGLEELRNTVQIPGFRRGRAPIRLVEKRFGEQVREDVKNSLTSECFEEAVQEHKLVPLTQPQFDNVEFDPEKPFSFEATFEIQPTINLEEYKGLKLVRRSAEPADDEVVGQLANLRLRRAELRVVEDGAIEDLDVIICDAVAAVEGEPIWQDENVEVFVAKGIVGGFYAQGLLEKLRGAKSGEQREVSILVPQNFEQEDLRGKEATLTLTIREIKRPVLPELDEEFAKALDFESLEELREEVKRQVRIQKRQAAERDLLTQLENQLIEKAPFEVPEDYTSEMTDRWLKRMYYGLLTRGVSQEEIEKNMADLRSASAKMAERHLRLSLILEHVANKERIFATEDEVAQQIEVIARAYKQPAPRIARRLKDDGSIDDLRAKIRESKTMQFLLENAEIEDEDANESK